MAPMKLEDRILWETVARTTRPLKGREPVTFAIPESEPELTSPAPVAAPAQSKPVAKPSQQPRNPYPLHHIDRTTHKKIARGKLDIEARIDLHGLTQSEAYGLLHGFLHRAHARGLRLVLVITGKGASYGSDGALRQAAPHWFATPMFRTVVSGYEDAARNHGGTGAFYVRLRRTQEVQR